MGPGGCAQVFLFSLLIPIFLKNQPLKWYLFRVQYLTFEKPIYFLLLD